MFVASTTQDKLYTHHNAALQSYMSYIVLTESVTFREDGFESSSTGSGCNGVLAHIPILTVYKNSIMKEVMSCYIFSWSKILVLTELTQSCMMCRFCWCWCPMHTAWHTIPAIHPAVYPEHISAWTLPLSHQLAQDAAHQKSVLPQPQSSSPAESLDIKSTTATSWVQASLHCTLQAVSMQSWLVVCAPLIQHICHSIICPTYSRCNWCN